jgi:two-component system phosphate regulon sensor histidine kinase PhoR
MTHELKTPISTISLACEALSDADIIQTPKLTANYVRMIGEENKRLATLVENVLQTAVLDKSEFTLQLEEVNMHEIIQKTVTSLGMHLDRNKIKLNLSLNAEKAIITGDQIHLTNGIFNLLDNAIKYRQEFPEINIETSSKEGYFVLKVSDNGIGISRDQQSKVFEKLYRVPTGNIHNVKGFGLGLSYVKAIVAKHKGTIKLESEVGLGSTFIVNLPFTQ